MPCKVVRILEGSHGKFPNSISQMEELVFMEYGRYLELLANYLPDKYSQRDYFKNFLLNPSKVTL